jgi:creatinine amidohydrolase
MMRSSELVRYEHLTWPEINEAAKAEKVILLPIGSTEQHGHHLPLDTDNLLATEVSLEAARRDPANILVMPNIPYGYNEHGQDFPGTIHVTYEHFIEYCLDVCKSVAYTGFKRIVIVDGHGSNEHLCEFIGRRATLETEALVASTMWTNLVGREFEAIRESGMGGAVHAGELETSVYLHLAPERVQMDKAADHYGGAAGAAGSSYLYVDVSKGWGPIKLVKWTSSGTPDGVSGAPTLATADKGRAMLDAAANHLVAFCKEFKAMADPVRVDHRAVQPKTPALPNLD